MTRRCFGTSRLADVFLPDHTVTRGGFRAWWLSSFTRAMSWQVIRFLLPLIALGTTTSPFRMALVSLALTLP